MVRPCDEADAPLMKEALKELASRISDDEKNVWCVMQYVSAARGWVKLPPNHPMHIAPTTFDKAKKHVVGLCQGQPQLTGRIKVGRIR